MKRRILSVRRNGRRRVFPGCALLCGAAAAWAGSSLLAPPAWPDAAGPSPPPTLATAMAGPLVLNPTPFKFALGQFGPIYGTGVLTGLGLAQTNPVLGDRTGRFDISNGQAIAQKIDGVLQFYAQAGIYALPALGTPYIRASTANSDFFGPLPEGYLKLAPTDKFAILGGKLPSLIGAEYTFTFENMNIERGLLWNQEPAISRGVQANYTAGPLTLSASFNDGFYSDRFNWLVGSAAWTINGSNTLTVVSGGNLGRSTTATIATPLPQNNGAILDLIYTYSAAPWTITPYFQFTHVPRIRSLDLYAPASTYGGAVLVNYAVTPRFNLAARAEIIAATGYGGNGAPNLLYGPGSYALSLTATPTWQIGRFFVRGEGSLVKAEDVTPGLAFGKSGNRTTQARFLIEAGFLF
ncbi:MAG TPA: outer membrane beta-barrel protein [Stellaceae bacterium]|nr:outer membrane beta-barrel protein [Stellaceae bacterium]